MKRKMMTVLFVLGLSISFAGCGETKDPGTPPADIIQGNDTIDESTSDSNYEGTSDSNYESTPDSIYDGSVMEGAVTIFVGQNNGVKYQVNMYNNAAADTMLGYLSNNDLLFPTYTYDAENGFSAQNIRGNYTRDDEKIITDIHAGEVYLFSDGQLRLYFKDVTGADITATPVGYLADAAGIEEAVTGAYEENQGDTWGVDVYFHIIKN